MYKNLAGQKFVVTAWDGANGTWKTGDASNITAQISKDCGASAATDDVNPTELDATNHPGVYYFNALQAESNADLIVVTPVSSTPDISFEPLRLYTTEVMRGTDGANTTVPDAAGTAAGLHATTDGLIGTAQADLDIITDADGVIVGAAGATAIIDEFETQSQADPTGFHVNVKEVNGTAQTANDNGADINEILVDTAVIGALGAGLTALSTQASVDAIKAETALIVADTNELQVDDTPGTLATIAGYIDGEIGQIIAAVITNAAGADVAADIIAIKAETAAIVNDTDVIDDGTSGLVKIAQDVAAILVDSNELQGDWTNTGRLDAILDTIAVDTTTDIPALIATAQADLDVITGATGVNLLAATQASIDAIEADTAEIGAAGAGLTALGDARIAELAAANLPADIDTLLTRLTDTRATYLDYLFSIYFGLVSVVAQAQDGAAGSITLTASASAVNDFYKGQIIVIYTGTGAGQARACYEYNGGTKVALTRPSWATAPDNTSWYVIISAGSAVMAAMEDIDFGATMKASITAAVPSVANILDGVIEGTLTLKEVQSIMLAVLAGISTGGGTATIAFRDQADTKDRVSATVDATGNRTAIIVDGT